MNKCVNIVFILLYSDTLFEGRNVYVQICKIKNKLCFIYVALSLCTLLNLYMCTSLPGSFLFLLNVGSVITDHDCS